MKDHVSLQERLKDLRVEKGLKLEELAEKTGISKSALASYENEENRNKEINHGNLITLADFYEVSIATVYKGNIIKNLIMDCQSYTKYRPNETTGGIFVSWRRKEELPTGA